jgi:putative alpha-1,2-mannosidase
VLGAPYFPYFKVNLENGKSIVIRADRVSDRMRYVKSVKLNGQPYRKAFITYDDLKDGAELTFEMSATPNKKRLFSEDEKPYSLTK